MSEGVKIALYLVPWSAYLIGATMILGGALSDGQSIVIVVGIVVMLAGCFIGRILEKRAKT